MIHLTLTQNSSLLKRVNNFDHKIVSVVAWQQEGYGLDPQAKPLLWRVCGFPFSFIPTFQRQVKAWTRIWHQQQGVNISPKLWQSCDGQIYCPSGVFHPGTFFNIVVLKINFLPDLKKNIRPPKVSFWYKFSILAWNYILSLKGTFNWLQVVIFSLNSRSKLMLRQMWQICRCNF